MFLWKQTMVKSQERSSVILENVAKLKITIFLNAKCHCSRNSFNFLFSKQISNSFPKILGKKNKKNKPQTKWNKIFGRTRRYMSVHLSITKLTDTDVRKHTQRFPCEMGLRTSNPKVEKKLYSVLFLKKGLKCSHSDRYIHRWRWTLETYRYD